MTRPRLPARDRYRQADLPFVMSDPVKVHQIVSNLLDNAFKYSDPTADGRHAVERIGDDSSVLMR